MGFGIGDPWDKDQRGADMESIKKIARLIRQVDANIVALQEVAHNRYNADIKYYLETLATELNMNYAFGAHGYNDPYEIIPVEGHWGNAILSTFPIKNIHNQEVEYRSVWERRSMIDAQLHINDSTVIHALSLHYLPTQEGIDRTAAYLPQLGDPYILMGDFNYIGPIAEFEPLGVSDVDSIGFTHIIDRIFVDKSIFTVDEIGAAIDTMQTSDHPANFAVLRLK